METIHFDNDIHLLYVEASSFPEGVQKAHERIHALIPQLSGRRFFGISRPENGVIKYKAAAEQLTQGEAVTYDCKTITLKNGTYISVTIHNFMNDISSIGTTFNQLIKRPDIDPNGYCVEWYIDNKDVKCMVRLKD